MTRAWTALKGWRKLRPGGSKRPHPRVVWAVVCVQLMRRGSWRMAAAAGAALLLYLRMRELMTVRLRDFLPPTTQGKNAWCLQLHLREWGDISKTGKMDENLPLDTKNGDILTPVLTQFRSCGTDALLVTGGYVDYYREFKAACRDLALDQVLPSESRHSGISIDLASPKIGRWKQIKSLRRYEKSGELSKSWAGLSAQQRQHFLGCESGLESTLLRKVVPTPTGDLRRGLAASTTKKRSAATADMATAGCRRANTRS